MQKHTRQHFLQGKRNCHAFDVFRIEIYYKCVDRDGVPFVECVLHMRSSAYIDPARKMGDIVVFVIDFRVSYYPTSSTIKRDICGYMHFIQFNI